MLNIAEYRELIRISKEDGWERESALSSILEDIRKYHMDRYLRRYLNKATTGGMDSDDIRQIFLIGCSEAIEVADPDIGDPRVFIIQRGKWKVVDILRNTYRKNIRQICNSCGCDTKILERYGVPICRECGIEGHEYIERYNIIDGNDLAISYIGDQKDIQNEVMSDLIIERFGERLGGRKREIFDLIMHGGFDRDSCKNYIAEIADILGVSRGNVNLRLRVIKKELEVYLNELGYVS